MKTISSIFFPAVGAFILCFAVSTCERQPAAESPRKTLAKVGASSLTVAEARRAIPPFMYKKDSVAALNRYRDQWVMAQLQANEADKRNLAAREDVKEALRQARQRVLANALKQTVIEEQARNFGVSDEKVQSYYEKHKQQLALKERYVRYRHFSNSSLGATRNARQRMLDGDDWADVVRQNEGHVEERLAEAKTYWPAASVLNDVPIMHRYIAQLDSGDISPIQRHEGTYHFVELVDVRGPGTIADASWFGDDIRRRLVQEKQRRYYDSYLKNLYFEQLENNEIAVYNVTNNDETNTQLPQTQSNE